MSESTKTDVTLVDFGQVVEFFGGHAPVYPRGPDYADLKFRNGYTVRLVASRPPGETPVPPMRACSEVPSYFFRPREEHEPRCWYGCGVFCTNRTFRNWSRIWPRVRAMQTLRRFGVTEVCS